MVLSPPFNTDMKKILMTACCVAALSAIQAQDKRIYTPADYERAESMLAYNTSPLVDRAEVRPSWVGNFCWYRVLTAQGSEFVLVDAAKKTRTAFPDKNAL